MTTPPDMRAPLTLLPLRLDNVVFAVGSRRIIDGVSLTLAAATRTMIVGPNGAGKSVLLRLCHGLLRPTAGTIHWNAPDIDGAPDIGTDSLERARRAPRVADRDGDGGDAALGKTADRRCWLYRRAEGGLT